MFQAAALGGPAAWSAGCAAGADVSFFEWFEADCGQHSRPAASRSAMGVQRDIATRLDAQGGFDFKISGLNLRRERWRRLDTYCGCGASKRRGQETQHEATAADIRLAVRPPPSCCGLRPPAGAGA